MKKLLKNSIFRILITIAGTISLFVFLFTYIIPNTLTSPLSKAITVGLFVVFAVIFVVTMIAELFYDEASKALVIDANLEKANSWMKKMKTIDILGWYKDRYLVFMTLYYHDKNDSESLDQLLEHPAFKSNPSMELVYNYNQFLLAIKHEKREKVDYFYDLIMKVYSNLEQAKKQKIALVYPVGIIKAEYNLFNSNPRTSISNLKAVNYRMLNKREKAKFNYLKYKALYLQGNKNKAQEFYLLAQKDFPQADYIQEIGANQ